MNNDEMASIGVVGVPGGWSSQRLVAAFEERRCRAHLIDVEKLTVDLHRGAAVCGGVDVGSLDAVVVKKIGLEYRPEMLARLALLRFVAGGGVRVFSDPLAIARVIDRLSCTVTLRLGGVPIPPTVVTEDIDEAAEAVRRFDRAVLKPLYTSKARGMRVVHRDEDVRDAVRQFKAAGNDVLYVQKMLRLPGRDLGLAFLGGRFLTCYARVAGPSSWCTAVQHGGRYEAHDASPAIIDIAHRAQSLFQLDFTCVDVAETEEGPVVFEVSAFGGFRGLWEARRLDAAAAYADYVLEKIARGE